MYGKKIIFVWGSIWITVTSILVPVIPNEIGFDVFRGLQGLGAAAMVPTAIGILGTTFPPGKAKNYAFACYGGGAPLGGVFGNIFAGVLGQYLEWKWVFWIFGILTALVTVTAIYVIPPPPVKREPQLTKMVDWIGGAIVTVGLIILLFALSEGNVVGWNTPWVGTLIGVSILLLVAFGFWQHYLETKTDRKPLMKISIFKNVRFTAANAIMLMFFSSFNNFLIYATYWFQEYQGLSIIQTTIRFIPMGVTGGKYAHRMKRFQLRNPSPCSNCDVPTPLSRPRRLHPRLGYHLYCPRFPPLCHTHPYNHHLLGLRLPRHSPLSLWRRHSFSNAHSLRRKVSPSRRSSNGWWARQHGRSIW